MEDGLLKAAITHPHAVLSCLPRIFESYLEVTSKHRNTLYSQSSSRGAGATLEQARAEGLKFFASCSTVLDHMEANERTWRIRTVLLDKVELWSLLRSNGDASTGSLTTIAEQAHVDIMADMIC